MTSHRRRLWLVDHMLRDEVGHHLGYNLALAGAAVDEGWEPVLVSHREFPNALAANHATRPIFHTDWRAAPPTWTVRHMGLLRALERFSSWRFAADLARLHDTGADDVVFAQMIAPRHFLQWLKWRDSMSTSPHLVLHLGYQPARFGAEARAALAHARKIHLVTDSEKLVPAFETALGQKVHYLSHVISYEIPAPDENEPAHPISLLSLGNARREKGFADIARAASLLAPEREAGVLQFRLQCHQPDPDSARVERPDGPGLEWLSAALADNDYVAQLIQADVVLLPYHLDHYAMRTSGVFCEARVAGKPVVATEGSWAGDRIAREGGGWLVPERDPAALAICLKNLPVGIAEKTHEARAIVPAARQEFCRHTFVRGLVALAD